jgi:Interferon-induced transmembrane protein/GYF domain 2
MQWYYSKNGTQLGPITEAELRSKIAFGEVSATDMVWKDGMPDWLQAGKVEGFSLSAPSLTSTPPIPGTQMSSPYTPPSFQAMPLQGGAEIPNYLWQSIVVTIFCCWPFGIPAIVYAAKVDGLKARGDIPNALVASSNAKKWCIISLAVWGVFIVIYLIFIAVTVMAGAAGN